MSSVELPLSLAQHVRKVLRDDIRTGRLKPGERIAEVDVMRRAGVSRTPVREGMHLLEAEGLVVASRNRGVRVARALKRQEALAIYDCRLALEPQLIRLAAERVDDEALRRVAEIVGRFERGLERGSDEVEFSDVDWEFHMAVYAPSESPLLVVFRSYWSKLQIELTRRVYSRESPRHFHEEHLEILGALQERDAEAAVERMRRHIDHGRRVLADSYGQEA